MSSLLTDVYAPGLGNVAVVTAPAAEPADLTEVKLHLRVDHNVEDGLIADLIKQAREWCESKTDRQFVTATYDWRLDGFPAKTTEALWVPRPPLQSVTSINYVDTAGASQLWSSTLYQVDIYNEPGRILPAYGQVWPSTRDQLNAVTVRFVCGYGAASAVPESVNGAIKMLVEHWFDPARGATSTRTVSKELEFSVNALLASVAVKKAA